MSSTATNTLRYYTPGVYSVLANVALSAFLFGCLTVLLMVSIHYLIRRGVTQPSTAFMLGSVLILYVSTATHFGVAVTYSVGYGRLLNDAVVASSSMSIAGGTMLTQFQQRAKTMSYIISLVLAVNMTLGDAIVWWRVCVLYRQKLIFALGVALIACTFGFGILSTIHWPNSLVNIDMSQPLLSYGDVYGGLSGLLSLVTNVIATLLIGRKAWEHRQVLRQRPGAANGQWSTPAMKILILFVESGVIYSVLLIVAVVYNMLSRSHSSQAAMMKFVSMTRMFLTGCFVPILAIYPTIIIFVIALNRSVIEGSLMNADSPSAIPTHFLPSTIHQSGASTICMMSSNPVLYLHTSSVPDSRGLVESASTHNDGSEAEVTSDEH